MRSNFKYVASLVGMVALAGAASGQTFDLNTDWSDTQNPNGAWSYREGNNALPAVASWQAGLGGWNVAQPGWARSQDGNNRLPFWFKSNGSENFVHDFIQGDVVVHTTDDTNGVGQGFANVAWTSPSDGEVNVSGGVWMGRDIGRANVWQIYLNDVLLTTGTIGSGDAYDRATPMGLNEGSGGTNSVSDLVVSAGDVLRLEFQKASQAGDFVGVNMTISLKPVPTPGALGLLGVGMLAMGRRRRA